MAQGTVTDTVYLVVAIGDKPLKLNSYGSFSLSVC